MGLNPVEKRLALLCGDWIDFRSEGSNRLLIWQVAENAMRIVQCFFETQKHDLEYSSGDLFIVLDPPFDHSIQYSKALKEALRGQYDASRHDLEQEGLSTDWSFVPGNVADTAAGVVSALSSFGAKYCNTNQHLVGVLTPTAVADDELFAGWLLRALANNLPEHLRLVIVDSIENPRFSKLAEASDPRIARRSPPIDGLSTAQETFAQEAAVGPAAVFRNHLMGVVTLLEKGTADEVKAKAKDAFKFARAQKWPDQEVVLRVLVAGAMLKESRCAEAIDIYRAAQTAAEQALAAEHPAGRKLVLQALFGEAGAHLAAGDPLSAAGCYDRAAVNAQKDRNIILAIEAHRMGAFCHARTGAREEALRRSLRAIEVGVRIKPDERGMTSLPIAAMDLLRTLEPDRARLLEECRDRLERRLADARRKADVQASDLERNPDPAAGRPIERALDKEAELARAEAEGEIAAIVTQSSPAFRDHFMKASNLLGATWPLQSTGGNTAASTKESREAAAS
jgi:hypothetical protein